MTTSRAPLVSTEEYVVWDLSRNVGQPQRLRCTRTCPTTPEGPSNNRFGGHHMQRVRGFKGGTDGPASPVKTYSKKECVGWGNGDNAGGAAMVGAVKRRNQNSLSDAAALDIRMFAKGAAVALLCNVFPYVRIVGKPTS